MRVERNHHRCAARTFGVARGSGNDGLMTEMHAVKRANGKKERTLQVREIGCGTKDFHHENDE
jgi:hypothetical protein